LFGVKKIIKVFISTIFIFVLSLVFSSSSVLAFAGGTGTSGDPYQITTAAELQSVNSYLGSSNSGKYFKVMNSIDLNVSPYNSGSGWTPIGTSSNKFYAHFDGNYKNISNLYINSSSGTYLGLFGAIASGGIVQNTYLTTVNITAGSFAGSLAGSNAGTIQNSGVSGGTFRGNGMRVGGLVGEDSGGLIRVFAKVTVTYAPTSTSCCAGGLTGEVAFGGSAATIYDSYSRSSFYIIYNMYDQGSTGGLLGNDYSGGSKYNLYSAGAITYSGGTPYNVGGLSGGQYTSISSSYWDTQSSNWPTSFGGAGVVGKTTTLMKTQSTFSGWDFTNTWAIDTNGVVNDGYPYLQWQNLTSTNQTPNVPSSLGGSSMIDGSAGTGTQPAFSFTLSDPDVADTTKFQIQIDTHSNFSAPVIDYTSALTAQGAMAFTVGQATGSGTYVPGTFAANLSDGSYYWRVKATDNSNSSSGFTTANSGSIAFKIDTVAPTTPGTPTTTSPTLDTTPTWTWTASTDSTGGLAITPYTVEWCSNSSFTNCTENSATSAVNSYTISGALTDGTWYFRVKSTDVLDHVSDYSSNGSVVIDTLAPTISGVSSTSPSSSTETISWTTNESASTTVNFGLTESLGSSTSISESITGHSITINTLTPCTVYYYKPVSVDSAGNSKTGDLGSFTTSGCTGSATIGAHTVSSPIPISASGGSTSTTVNLVNNNETATLTVPVGYSNTAANFQIKQLNKTSVIAETSTPQNYSAIGNLVYDFKALVDVSTAVSTFLQPITVSMVYTASDVLGIDEDSLWMYRWDNSTWNELDDCVTEKSSKTITCTTSNFSTFVLFGKTAATNTSTVFTSTSSTSNSAPSCLDTVPVGTLNLFQIDPSQNSVILNFSTVGNTTGYQIFYGTSPEASDYADKFDYQGPLWTLTRKISGLKSGVKYYFKVRPVSGCSAGSFSQTVPVTTTSISNEKKPTITPKPITKDLINPAKMISNIPAVSQVVDKKIVVQKTKINPKPLLISYIAKSGDTFWSIAQKFFGHGKDYVNLPYNQKISSGTELMIDASKLSADKIGDLFPELSPQKNGYDLDVKILADAGTPMKNVKVTLHSTPITKLTNDQGVAHFTNIEPGKHQILLAYKGYTGGGQAIELTGQNKNLEIVMQISLTEGFNSPKVMGVIIFMGLIIGGLVFVIVKQRKNQRLS
jgi:hypothetical protein